MEDNLYESSEEELKATKTTKINIKKVLGDVKYILFEYLICINGNARRVLDEVLKMNDFQSSRESIKTKFISTIIDNKFFSDGISISYTPKKNSVHYYYLNENFKDGLTHGCFYDEENDLIYYLQQIIPMTDKMIEVIEYYPINLIKDEIKIIEDLAQTIQSILKQIENIIKANLELQKNIMKKDCTS